MLFVARLRRPLMVAGCVASAAAFSLDGPARSRCLKLEMSDCAARSLSASLQAVLAKPPLVEHWEAKQGEHAFLEDVLGERALDWVRGSNAQALERLGDPTGSPLFERIFAILTSKEKIPFLRKIGDQYYNFWTDEANPRGVWRRTSLESYRSGAPEWETVLDVDALNRAEGESWVYKGHTLYHPPDGTAPTRTLLQLSRGGADATVVREFDLRAKAFVGAAEGGFELPEAKSRVAWQSADTLLIGTDFGDGASLTDSGYPRTVREWATCR